MDKSEPKHLPRNWKNLKPNVFQFLLRNSFQLIVSLLFFLFWDPRILNLQIPQDEILGDYGCLEAEDVDLQSCEQEEKQPSEVTLSLWEATGSKPLMCFWIFLVCVCESYWKDQDWKCQTEGWTFLIPLFTAKTLCLFHISCFVMKIPEVCESNQTSKVW